MVIKRCVISAKESKSVKFNEEVEVKTVEPIPEVIEIDEVCTSGFYINLFLIANVTDPLVRNGYQGNNNEQDIALLHTGTQILGVNTKCPMLALYIIDRYHLCIWGDMC